MSPSLVHTIPPSTNAWVTGLALADDKLFVTRYQTKHIDVYDTDAFQLRHTIKVTDGGYVYGLAACPHNKCLYAADFNEKKIHRIDLATEQATNWTLDQCPSGLFVTKEGRLLVAYHAAKILDEYSTDGSLFSRINIQSDGSEHALRMSDDRVLISCGWGSTHSVSELSQDGTIVRSYCEENSNETKQLNGISCLAIDKEDNILVSDWSGTGRILVLDSSLNWSHDLQLPSIDNGMQEPYTLCLDEARKRLYVGERGGKRVLVFDDVNVASS